MKYFSLFSGIGGFELGFPSNWKCVGFSEIAPYSLKVYESHFPTHKNYGDVTKIDPSTLPDFDLLCGGFPCQSFSRAGSRGGLADARGTLFFDICRIAKEKQPRVLLLENVRALLDHDEGRTFEVILKALDELGYDAEWQVFDSWFFNAAPRSRIYILAVLRDSEADAEQRTLQTLPLYSCFNERSRNPVVVGEKDMRDAERTVRAFAKLPTWLDSWDTVYVEKVRSGERGLGQRSKSNLRSYRKVGNLKN